MTTGPSQHLSPEPAEVAATMRLLAEAADQRSFFLTLRCALPALLPGARVDLLAPGGTNLLLVGEDRASPPAEALRSATGFAEWLAELGFCSVSTVPLAAGGQHFGWLAFARHTAVLTASDLAVAGQIAAVAAVRLLYEQLRDEQRMRDEYAAHLERRLHEYEDVRLQATLAIGAAHDIGNLFASISGHAQLLQHATSPELQADVRAILQAAGDGYVLLRRLMAVRPPTQVSDDMPLVALSSVAQDALALTRPFWASRNGIALRMELGRTPRVRAYAAELREVLVNLIINALGAMPGGGTLTLRSYAADAQVIVEVSDTGRGISPEHQQTIFQPFVTSRQEGGGLGLSVSRAIVEGYGGTLGVHSSPGNGATFTLALPVVQARMHAQEWQPQPVRVVSG